MGAKWLITDGQNKRTVTQAEYSDLVSNRPAYLPKITVLSKGKMRAVGTNQDGDMYDEMVDPAQIEKAAEYGEDVSATPEKIEAARKDKHRRDLRAIAEEENLTSFTNAALPGAQFMQNMAVGVEAAKKAREELSTNVIANLTGNIAEFAIGSKALSMGAKYLLGADRAAKIGTKIGFGEEAGLVSRAGRLVAEDVAIETHLYTQQLIDNNAEFVAEDLAQQIGVGMLMASPLILGGMARAGGQAVLKSVGPGAATKLSSLGDVLGTAAVLAPPGTMDAALKARGAAAAHIAGRVMRKVSRKGKGANLSATDELIAQQDRLLDDMATSGGFTPDRIARMKPGKRAQAIEDYRALVDGDASWLDEVDWDGIPNATEMTKQSRAIRKQILGIHRRFKGEGNGAKMSQRQYADSLQKANELLKHVEDAGMSDVKGALRRGIIAEGDAAGMQSALFEARINARFRRGVDGGADIVDDQLRAFTEDTARWGAVQARRNAEINTAIDGVVDVWDTLGDAATPRHLESIELGDALKVGKSQTKIQELRQHMDVLTEHKILTDDQIRGIETKLVEANDALVKGSKAYADILTINKSRVATNTKLRTKKDLMGADVPTTQEGFAAGRDAMVGETAGQIVELGKSVGQALAKGIQFASDPSTVTPLIRGVAGLQYLSLEEKQATFETIQKELPTLTGNPQYAIAKMAPILERSAQHDPAGADLAGMKITNTMYWLASQMPKPDDTLYGRQVPQPISLQEEYLEKHFAAYDPISVAYAAIQGRVTQGMVDAVRVTNPAMYAQLGSVMAEQLAKVEAGAADPKVVSGIGLFMGTLDPMYSGTFIMQLQSTYAQTATQDGVIQGGAANMPRAGQPGSGQSQLTTSQRQQQ